MNCAFDLTIPTTPSLTEVASAPQPWPGATPPAQAAWPQQQWSAPAAMAEAPGDPAPAPAAWPQQQWAGVPPTASVGGGHGKLLALISIGIVLVLVVAGGGYVALSRGGNQAQSNNPQLSEAGYRAACREIAASELTDHADADRGSYVKVAGTVVVYETDLGAAATTRLIISVTDPTNRLGSGKLPVLVSYQGKTSAFINDTVTVYGQVYGNFDYQSAQIAKKTLPRVDAAYIDIAP